MGVYLSSYNLASAIVVSNEVGDCATASLLISLCNPLKRQLSKALGGRPNDQLTRDMNLR